MNVLKLDDAPATMKKISINVLGKDADNTLFTLPLEGIELSREQLDAYFGARTFEAWYQVRKDKSQHPMDFWKLRKNGDFQVDDEFTCDAVTLELSGGKKLEFETVEADEEDEDSEATPAAKIHSLTFTPTSGGITRLSLHMQVRPGIGKDNLALQEHQFRLVRVTLGELTKVQRKSAQQDLPLEPRPESGGFTQQTPASEMDAKMRAAHPEAPTMGDHAKPANGEGDGFEEGARKQVEAFNAKKGQVIDGRSERVKHRDRTRGAH